MSYLDDRPPSPATVELLVWLLLLTLFMTMLTHV